MKESERLYRFFRFLKRALLGLAALFVALLLFGYFFFMRHGDAPKAWSAADRELQGGMLHFGEKIERKAKVFMRRPSDYYRGANGILYAGSYSGAMYALKAETGEVLFTFASGGSVIDAPSIVNGTVYWGSGYRNIPPGTGNNKVYAFTAK